MQFLAVILLAVFDMIGDGKSSSGRLAVGWIFLSLLFVILLLYLSFEFVRMIAFFHEKRTGVNLWEKWGLLNKVEATDSDGDDSEDGSNTDSFNS